MLTEYAKSILKANRITEDDVEELSANMEVTFKDGTKRTICEVITRCMGYFRPVTEFNKGKYSEFKSRKYFTEDNCKGPDDAA